MSLISQRRIIVHHSKWILTNIGNARSYTTAAFTANLKEDRVLSPLLTALFPIARIISDINRIIIAGSIANAATASNDSRIVCACFFALTGTITNYAIILSATFHADARPNSHIASFILTGVLFYA